MSRTLNAGILYVATGDTYVREAEFSAASVKKIHPELPVCLISDLKVSSPVFDITQKLDSPEHGFIDKITGLMQSPFARTLFLDTDTVVLSPIEGIFRLLERFDIAVAHEPARFLYPLGGVPDEFPEMNTGVMLFKQSVKFEALANDWLQRYRDENARKLAAGQPLWHDQISFTKALWASDLRVWALPPEWNYRAPFPQFLCGDVRVFHGRLLNGKSDLSFVNRDRGGRILNPNPRRIFSIVSNTFKIFRTISRL